MGYTKNALDLLDWCLATVKSVDYPVSTRWIFYRTMQKFSLEKNYYKNSFIPLLSRARKKHFRGWQPDTLTDDTREIIEIPYFESPNAWALDFGTYGCTLDHWTTQPNIAMVAFEARAMVGQFKHYLRGYRLPLIPFGGDASINHKWNIAALITRLSKYRKPINVLYYGDLDKKGVKIAEAAFKDIRAWTDADFTVTRIGLTLDQAKRYGIPENFEKPGEYQWEALDDSAARNLILEATSCLDIDALIKTRKREAAIERIWFDMIHDSVRADLFKEAS